MGVILKTTGVLLAAATAGGVLYEAKNGAQVNISPEGIIVSDLTAPDPKDIWNTLKGEEETDLKIDTVTRQGATLAHKPLVTANVAKLALEGLKRTSSDGCPGPQDEPIIMKTTPARTPSSSATPTVTSTTLCLDLGKTTQLSNGELGFVPKTTNFVSAPDTLSQPSNLAGCRDLLLKLGASAQKQLRDTGIVPAGADAAVAVVLYPGRPHACDVHSLETNGG